MTRFFAPPWRPGRLRVKTVGDASARPYTAWEALEATLAAQRALFAEEWDEYARIKVRMASHTGVAEKRKGGLLRSPVNRIARLLSTGHGGQVLLSATGGSTERQRRPGQGDAGPDARVEGRQRQRHKHRV